MNYIELFAGCGGLSLGLESIEGSNLIMANELSPMPAQTFAYNFFKEDFEKSKIIPQKTLWLSSNHTTSNMKERLREDPRDYPELSSSLSNSDITNLNSVEGGLIIGNIIHLNQFLDINPKLTELLANSFGKGSLDFVSGGPPCQSFSMAGMRKKDCDRNSLPWEFASFVSKVQPKFTVLENVTGILRAFQDGGEKYYAWIEVAKAFCNMGYIPLCLHVNAKYAGIPQNRPRFIMIGVRDDIYQLLTNTFNDSEKELFSSSYSFYNNLKQNNKKPQTQLECHDVTIPQKLKLYKHSFLSELVTHSDNFITVTDAIDDLRSHDRKIKPSAYVRKNYRTLNGKNYRKPKTIENHQQRNNSPLVKRRFRLYQVMQKVENELSKEVKAILKGTSDTLSDDAWLVFSRYDYLVENDSYQSFTIKSKFIEFIQNHATKKQTQKALNPEYPAPAALSIPDDACHYHHDELRTLTVREMARIQSFPDNFVFRSKVTTGGQMRKFEVPQYTQVGNAIPPLLGRAIGLTIQNLLDRLD